MAMYRPRARPGSSPACPQPTANSVSSEVGLYLGWRSTMGGPLRGGRGGKKYIKTRYKIYREKNKLNSYFWGILKIMGQVDK
jgi:hypothetical protein